MVNSKDKEKSVRELLLEEIFEEFFHCFRYVNIKRFRIKHRDHLRLINELVTEGVLREDGGKYEFHLRAYVESKWWIREKDVLNAILPVLQRLYTENPDGSYKCEDVISNALLIDNKRLLSAEVDRAITLFDRLGFIGGGSLVGTDSPRRFSSFNIREDVLLSKNIDEKIDDSIKNKTHMLTYPDKTAQAGGSFLDHIGKSFPQEPSDEKTRANKSADGVFETVSAKYIRVSVIGEGGAGIVYKVKNSDGDEFALKYLPPGKVTTDKVKRFNNEMHFCEKNPHPRILKVLDNGFIKAEEKKCPFYVMPIYGGTLRKLMTARIDPQNVLPYFSQLLDGAEAAHMKGVWHRDLKPENILFDPKNDCLVIADFGIASFKEEDLFTTVETKPGTRLANLQYAAPEQRKKGGVVDSLADIYALGLILNEMFTGEVPQGAGYKTIASVSPEFKYLDDVVSQMIQQNPNSRPKKISEIKNELIAQKNIFVAAQKLDEKRGEVVPISTPGVVEPVTLIGVDYQKGMLIFELSRSPESDWIRRFKSPKERYSYIPGKGPESFGFSANNCTIPTSEADAQMLTAFFKQYSEMATRGYQIDLLERAKSEEESRRKNLELEAKDASIRLNLLKNLKI